MSDTLDIPRQGPTMAAYAKLAAAMLGVMVVLGGGIVTSVRAWDQITENKVDCAKVAALETKVAALGVTVAAMQARERLLWGAVGAMQNNVIKICLKLGAACDESRLAPTP